MIQEKENFTLTNWELVSVNPVDKNWTWKNLFCFWGVNVQTLIFFSLIASFYLLYDLNILIVLSGSVIASLLVFIFSNLIGKPSQKYGLPFPVILRTSMGVNGARFVALLRGVVGVFMFGVQTFFISKSIGYLIRVLIFIIDSNLLDESLFLIFFMGINIIDGIALLITLIIQYYLFSRGKYFLKSFISFSAYFVYFGLISVVYRRCASFNNCFVVKPKGASGFKPGARPSSSSGVRTAKLLSELKKNAK